MPLDSGHYKHKNNIIVGNYILDPIIYFFDGKTPSRHTTLTTEFLHLAGAIMEYFL